MILFETHLLLSKNQLKMMDQMFNKFPSIFTNKKNESINKNNNPNKNNKPNKNNNPNKHDNKSLSRNKSNDNFMKFQWAWTL